MTSDETVHGERDAEDESTEISKDELFHILQNERRRQVLRYVVNREGPFEMRSIAEQVAAWEHDTTVRELTSDERQRVYIALYQSHLSKLDEAGLIEYQQNRGIVEVTDAIDVVIPHVDGIEDHATDADDDAAAAVGPVPFASDAAPATGWYFAGATLLSLALTAGVWSNLIPASLLGPLGLTVVVIAIFAATGVVQLGTERRDTDA
jgi:DNA-binding transcriptional ArsR family regulator